MGPACGTSFAGRLRSVQLDKASLETAELHNYYDAEAIRDTFGEDAPDRYWDETDGRGAARTAPDGTLWAQNRKTKEYEQVAADHYLGEDLEV